MTTPEEQAMLAKISRLAGVINRHKNGQAVDQPSPGPRHSDHGGVFAGNNYHTSQGYGQYPGHQQRGGYPARGYGRGARAALIHRNRSLVLNGITTPTSNDGTVPGMPVDENSAPTPGAAWVTKQDRHLQLINSSIYEKDSQKRAKAMEETRQQKLKQREERERAKFSRHLQRGGHNSAVSRPIDSSRNYEINVEGIQFSVTKNGSKLIKAHGDMNAAKATPKTATIGGVRFYRSKNGNMYRSGIVKAYRYGNPSFEQAPPLNSHNNTDNSDARRTGIVKKVDEPCKIFSTTGSCPNGPRCRYNHDPSKVAVCKDFLQKGSCPSGNSCDLSHELTPERTPTCMHFSKGNCSNPNCRYQHIRVSPNALVCRPFGIYGYCEKGADCTKRHLHECPDFSNTGTCTTKGCKLLHRHKASLMRSTTARSDQLREAETSDISSDEEGEEIDSDDVDSDDLEFFGEDDGKIDSDVPMQQDFIQL